MKIILGVLLGFIVALFIIQNTEVTEVRFLFWSVAMSRALMYFLLFALGIFTGWLLHAASVRHRNVRGADRPD